MLKVLAIPSSNPGGEYNACSYMRVLNPLGLLDEQGRISFHTSNNWRAGRSCDVFYLQRFCGSSFQLKDAMDLAEFCQKNGRRIIYEIDDDLLDIEDLPQPTKALIRFLLRNADTVVTTTDNLRERLLKLNRHIAVIPNMLSIKQVGERHEERARDGIVRMGYMGTFTHQGDFQMILLPVMRLLKRYPESLELELVGGISDMGLLGTMPNIKRISIEGRDNYLQFWKWVKEETHWDIGLAPLKLSKFTACKSDVKYLDYAAMGCCGVFSDHPAYSCTVRDMENGMLAENDAEVWSEKIEQLILDSGLRDRLTEAARDNLYEQRLLEKNVGQWEKILEEKG